MHLTSWMAEDSNDTEEAYGRLLNKAKDFARRRNLEAAAVKSGG